MRTQVIETVMTREDWERNYLKEYRRELRESFVDTCKGILGVIVGAYTVYKFMCIMATIIEVITGNMSLF